MDTILGVYLVWSGVCLFILFGSLIGYGVSRKEVGIAGVGIAGFILSLFLFSYGLEEYYEPKAMDVYQGKTILEYTMRDGIVIDSVVIYKDEMKK